MIRQRVIVPPPPPNVTPTRSNNNKYLTPANNTDVSLNGGNPELPQTPVPSCYATPSFLSEDTTSPVMSPPAKPSRSRSQVPSDRHEDKLDSSVNNTNTLNGLIIFDETDDIDHIYDGAGIGRKDDTYLVPDVVIREDKRPSRTVSTHCVSPISFPRAQYLNPTREVRCKSEERQLDEYDDDGVTDKLVRPRPKSEIISIRQDEQLVFPDGKRGSIIDKFMRTFSQIPDHHTSQFFTESEAVISEGEYASLDTLQQSQSQKMEEHIYDKTESLPPNDHPAISVENKSYRDPRVIEGERFASASNLHVRDAHCETRAGQYLHLHEQNSGQLERGDSNRNGVGTQVNKLKLHRLSTGHQNTTTITTDEEVTSPLNSPELSTARKEVVSKQFSDQGFSFDTPFSVEPSLFEGSPNESEELCYETIDRDM